MPSLPLDTTIDGFRVTLRMPEKGDWKDWRDVRKRNRDALIPYEPKWPDGCLKRDFFMKRLKRQKRMWKTDSSYSFLVIHNENAQLIGGVNVNNVSRGAAQFASLGYWLDTDFRGRGLMTESLRLIIRFSFERLKLHRLNASCIPDNEKSRKILERLGFSEEGFAEKYIQINGQWRDHVLYGLPRENWQKQTT